MKTGYQIAQLIKEIKTEPASERLARAMFVAHAVGFYVQLDMTHSVESNVEAHSSMFRKILSEINENVAVDTKSAQLLFTDVIRIRMALVTGFTDPSLVEAALRSVTAELHQNAKEVAVSGFLLSRPEFKQAQSAIGQILSQHLADKQ